ncbi:MAG: hypothetical protein CL943_01290 [Candidatus Diapherotrites archaeon]|uniref:Uncharacterized protein n=1 Tax=Candidatus Iainarchaeum sp. TaxID=3101447 RepID=A0A2D6M0G5_9ARCH|nr:hypothetical protein [Candidatus Diapherotrites archaeon]
MPIAVSADKAKELIQTALASRNWKDIFVEKTKLFLVPYYFFEYHTYSEKEHNGEKIVSEVKKGVLVLDPETSEIVKGIAESLPPEKQMMREIPQEQEFEIKKAKLEIGGAKKIALLKTAEMIEKPLDKVSILNLKKFYVPLWEMSGKIAKQDIVVHISAVDGNILEEDLLPYREKSAKEITKEALNELKDPKTWLKYTQELVEMAGRNRGGERSALMETIMANRYRVASVILVIVLIIIVLFL